MANNSVVTQDKLQEFYNTKVYPYLNGSANLGFTPIGTVISVMSNEAPDNYLVCDGTTYNISEYSDLANFFEDQFGSKNYFGGNGTTTFAVPDLRGEFLRGSGTNSHTNQGNGANVGVHQNATINPYLRINSGKFQMDLRQNSNKFLPSETDYEKNYTSRTWYQASTTTGSDATPIIESYTSRPTNTSVLYCIAYKNIYISTGIGGYPVEVTNPQDKQGLQFDGANNKWVNGAGGMHEYSTAEKVVATWIDGKPVYEKSYYVYFPTTGQWTDYELVDLSNLNIERLILFDGTVSDRFPYHYKINNDVYWDIWIPNKNANILSTGKWAVSIAQGVSIVLRYTKTTDTV